MPFSVFRLLKGAVIMHVISAVYVASAKNWMFCACCGLHMSDVDRPIIALQQDRLYLAYQVTTLQLLTRLHTFLPQIASFTGHC